MNLKEASLNVSLEDWGNGMKTPVIAVVGPTATGKTSLSVELAKITGSEIISADSMQIYCGMHIASAAPDDEEKKGVPHHLFEFLQRDEAYSVAEYVRDAATVCEDIKKRGKTPLFVGGTGLYVSSFIDNISFAEDKTDPSLREEISDEYDAVGGEEMIRRLALFDETAALAIHPNNKKRVVRAFEIYRSTGRTMTEQNENSKTEPSPYIPYIIGLKAEDRQFIYDRIDRRVDIMLENGLLAEAESAFLEGSSETAVQAIGHKEFFPYFRGEISLDEAVETLKRETRRYAKRQLTWFGRDPRTEWINIDTAEDVLSEAVKILERKGYFD